jgi:large-conductance mechanosensitive channel
VTAAEFLNLHNVIAPLAELMDWSAIQIVAMMTFIILLGVAMIDAKLWKMMSAQKDHNRKVEALLSEIRDRAASK